MTMVTRQIVGYDPKTERLAFEYFIPPEKWDQVVRLVPRNKNDHLHLYNYPIDISIANDILGIVGNERVSQNLRYFLECETVD